MHILVALSGLSGLKNNMKLRGNSGGKDGGERGVERQWGMDLIKARCMPVQNSLTINKQTKCTSKNLRFRVLALDAHSLYRGRS